MRAIFFFFFTPKEEAQGQKEEASMKKKDSLGIIYMIKKAHYFSAPTRVQRNDRQIGQYSGERGVLIPSS